MNHVLKRIVATFGVWAATGVGAQTVGTWMLRAGPIRITPVVTSSCLSAPDFGDGPGCTRADVGADTQAGGGVTYMWTDHMAVDVPVAMPFKHPFIGAGSMEGAGVLGQVQVLPMTVFVQYRFGQPTDAWRPYVGLGATYVHFFDETGSGTLTVTTNPGGSPTRFSVDHRWTLTPQFGVTWALGERWFVDVMYARSNLSTTTHLSTGQHLDISLDPVTVGVGVGYRF